jgi:hypothetical protein
MTPQRRVHRRQTDGPPGWTMAARRKSDGKVATDEEGCDTEWHWSRKARAERLSR